MLVAERPEQRREGLMILRTRRIQIAEGWIRRQVVEDASNVIPHWRANKELVRKQHLLEHDG